ncbi:MAG: hypothetical protein JXR63_07915 [Spirochaetales bacterium]|nr:hypothetical protein [Spirochaetales bacterium]
MEVNVNELIQTIKNDGLEVAKKKEDQIINDAKKEADLIVAKAKEQAEKIVNEAKAEADNFAQSGDAAVKQAGRDLILKLEDEIKKMFESILRNAVAENFSGKVLEESIVKAVTTIADDTAKLDILISEKDYAALEKSLKNAFKKQTESGLEIKPFKNLQSGFKLSQKDGSAFYDFSAKEISEMLSQLVNKNIAQLLK